MNKNNYLKLGEILKFVLAMSIIVSLTHCKEKEAQPEEENELITTVRLKFTVVGERTGQTFTWKDTDGIGGNMPQVQPIMLKANQTYQVNIEFLDESKGTAIDKTAEILKEADEHFIALTVIPASLVSYTITDTDSKNMPLGLTGMLKTNGLGSGTLNVRLRHQPPVNGVATKNGTAMPGSDDVNVTFNITSAP